jgi:tRNA(Ile)-lysidine synthase
VPVSQHPETGIPDAFLLHFAAHAFAPFDNPRRVGLAISGGSDSMAMLHLMARAAPDAGWQLRAVTVDHQLRPEAAREAQFVAEVCANLGVPHVVLTWDHGPITGNLMDRARRARYALMAAWARGHGIGHVALAHTASDQAETFLMGLSREAGLDGLSGMRPRFHQNDVTFVRPFLQQTRSDLRGFLTRHDLKWVEDPTNEDAKYSRVKARRALKALAPLGITEERLANTVHHLAMAQGVLRLAAMDAALQVVTEVAGALQIDRTAFRRLGPELDRRVLLHCIKWLKNDDYPPRAPEIERLVRAIDQGKSATLAGCRLILRADQILMVREPKDLAGPVPHDQIWDGRWRIKGPEVPGLQVNALGAAGLLACKGWRDLALPREVLLVTPALWQGDQLIAAPLAGKTAGWSASVSQSFREFLLSH